MSFVRSVLLLGGIACSIAFALFIGHAISTHERGPVLLGFGLLGIGVILLAIFTRTGATPAGGGH